MTLNPNQLYDAAAPVVDLYTAIELLILTNIASQFAGSYEQLQNNPYVWQSTMLSRSFNVQAYNASVVSENQSAIRSNLIRSMRETSLKHLDTEEAILKRAFAEGLLPFQPRNDLANDPAVLLALETYNRQAFSQLNQVNTTLLDSSRQAYLDIINRSVAEVIATGKSSEQAVRSTLTQWADRGIPVLQRADGARLSVEGHVRTLIRTSLNNVTNEIQDLRSQAFGSDLIEVSSHDGARPLCAPYQGRVYSLSGNHPTYPAFNSTSYGEPAGLFGINCGHQRYTFFEGISQERFRPTQNAAENAQQYKDSQRQRQLERSIRQAKHRQDVLRASGDEIGTKQAGTLLRARQARMREFINDTGRTRRYNRERIQGRI